MGIHRNIRIRSHRDGCNTHRICLHRNSISMHLTIKSFIDFCRPIPALNEEQRHQMADNDGEKLLERIRSCSTFEQIHSANNVIRRFMKIHGADANSRKWVRILIAAKVEKYTELYTSFFLKQ